MTRSSSSAQPSVVFWVLIAIDLTAMVAIGLSLMEIFSNDGQSAGLIPSSLAWPMLWLSVAVAAVCGFFQIRMVLRRKDSESE